MLSASPSPCRSAIEKIGAAVLALWGASLAVAGPALAAGQAPAAITGAGSSFAAPVYLGWSVPAAAGAHVRVNYQSVGSGAGVDQMRRRTINFGASDKPLGLGALKAARLYQFPSVISGLAVVYNIPGVKPGALKLDGPVLADIYAGTITRWNDKRLQALNPGMALPDRSIGAVHRADGSGTTWVFTTYLSRVSRAWRQSRGAGTLVAWAGGCGARGNDGMAALVKMVDYSLGYVEYAYANLNHLPTAQLLNAAGQYVAPSLQTFDSAVAAADFKAHGTDGTNEVDLINVGGAQSWPLMGVTYGLVATDPRVAQHAQGVKRFFQWGFDHGAPLARQLGYVSLPVGERAHIMQAWPAIQPAP
ncbi:phosphate ABC transporter substrate-binding protein PstS [Formicincola oecophyllae]|uniref:Phosphate-binding protein PstS n=1 Tax=Formicincola oecophyllae TaxID=2558361 RepID=A0A4Y6UDA4_9PROT|nr:phosphate ABC transporter substrate-binding protein PstS [Formicincola oecophyllae]QDH14381.1 phosphate ABC transporter substrate-binding protein PstS [Formicincola oecophyllae]